MHLLLYHWPKRLQTPQVHRSHDIEPTGQSQKTVFLVNASPT